ncbi:MAG TPA: ABC transporter substrate-binding protein [Candidatus Eisenbacteria bacterium]|nr:ABC transporter substrate-binding protein [Candidatus Eisenbacteria bacterium]
MPDKKKIRVYYRAPSHVPLWKVTEECGFLEKHGLEIDLGSMEGQRRRAAEGLKSGDLDIVSGNHHNLYARRALYGDPYVHIAQSNNSWRENFLVMGDGVNGLADLKGKRVGMDDYDGHTGLNVWLYLRKHGLEEGRDVELVTGAKRGVDRVREVMEKKYAATFIRAVDALRARKLGARILEVPTMPMIEGVTLTTTSTYVDSHEEEVRALLMALADAIHCFKTRRDDTLRILRRHCSELLRIESDEEWTCFYDTQAASLEPSLYPSIEAIENVFALALKRNPEIERFNPLALWDFHYLRDVHDSGYIRRLYQ